MYDTALRRWGKLKKSHVDVFTISEALAAGRYLMFTEVVAPANTVIIPANEMKLQVSALLSNQETFAIMGADGSVELVDFNLFGAAQHTSVAIFGRIQLRRGRDSSLQEVQVEGLSNANFSYVGDSVTVKGTSWIAPNELYLDNFDEYSMTGVYFGDTVGTNHALHIEGAFDLTGLTIVLVPDGVAS